MAEAHLRLILDETKTPDQERRIILERFMTALRTQEPVHVAEEGDLLTDEIAEKHGMEWFTPEYTNSLRQIRASRNRNRPAVVP